MPDPALSVIAAVSLLSSEASRPLAAKHRVIASRLRPATKHRVIASRLLAVKHRVIASRPLAADQPVIASRPPAAKHRVIASRPLAADPPVIASRPLAADQPVIASRLLAAKQSHTFLALFLILLLLRLAACARGSSQVDGWKALRSDMELRSEPGRGPEGETVLALLYSLVPGTEYGIERQMPIPGLDGRPSLRLTARSTRVLYLAVVLLDRAGQEHKSTTLLEPGEWRTLEFEAFEPTVADWSEISAVRFMDYTGLLIGQGSVSLKLVGLPQ